MQSVLRHIITVPSCWNKLLTAFSKLVHNLGQAVRRQLVDNLFADYARKNLTTCQQDVFATGL
jgi:hypothetical protein